MKNIEPPLFNQPVFIFQLMGIGMLFVPLSVILLWIYIWFQYKNNLSFIEAFFILLTPSFFLNSVPFILFGTIFYFIKFVIKKHEIYYTLFNIRFSLVLKRTNIQSCYIKRHAFDPRVFVSKLGYKMRFRKQPADFDNSFATIHFNWKDKGSKSFIFNIFMTIRLSAYKRKQRQQTLKILTEHWQLIDSENLEHKKPKQ